MPGLPSEETFNKQIWLLGTEISSSSTLKHRSPLTFVLGCSLCFNSRSGCCLSFLLEDFCASCLEAALTFFCPKVSSLRHVLWYAQDFCGVCDQHSSIFWLVCSFWWVLFWSLQEFLIWNLIWPTDAKNIYHTHIYKKNPEACCLDILCASKSLNHNNIMGPTWHSCGIDSLVWVLRLSFFHTGLRVANALLALRILVLTSPSVPPVLIILSR